MQGLHDRAPPASLCRRRNNGRNTVKDHHCGIAVLFCRNNSDFGKRRRDVERAYAFMPKLINAFLKAVNAMLCLGAHGRTSRMNIGGPEPAHADFLLSAAGFRNIVIRLHSHKRVHLHAESFFDA